MRNPPAGARMGRGRSKGGAGRMAGDAKSGPETVFGRTVFPGCTILRQGRSSAQKAQDRREVDQR